MSRGTSEGGFAELLRELKNRSGHSYGTLAKRLHMSTSTLHRYCNGDAVPTDYAPVERLARLCKATPDELVDLHRRWVLADAGRGRKAPAPEPAAGEPQAPPAAQAPETLPMRAGAAEDPGHRNPDQNENRSQRQSQNQTQHQTWSRDRSGDADRTEGAGRAEGADRTGRPGWTRNPKRNRAVLLAAALTVTALLGGVAVALNLPSDEGRPEDGKAARAVTRSAGTGTPGRAPVTPTTGSPTPHPSAVGSASPSPRSPAPDGEEPAAPSPRASTTAGTSADPPLTVSTQPYAWKDPCSPHYLIDRPPAEVSPPPVEQDAPAWVDVHHAVPAGEQYVTFTVQGTGKETVVLEGLYVRMAGKRSPLAWNDYAMGYPGVGCGGGVPTRSFTVALDAMRPAPLPEAGSRGFPFKVSQSDPETFHITADASAYEVSWYLELAWSSGSRHGTLLIDDAGRPFRTSGNNSRPAYAFPLGGEKWQPASDAD
ncbi:helix-turn-helix domain-containing protein [Streptomyces sp. SID2955]|nr:helix-turn-helix domain-containing protein [Streptomyces sp. SID2955]